MKAVAKKPCTSRFTVDRKVVSYESDDSGVEWYGDIDDLENADDLDDFDDDEAELAKAGLMRADGFEDDHFIIDSDDEEAMGDKDAMRDMAKNKALRSRLKDEYPVRPQRTRGDMVDRPITVRLPAMSDWAGHGVLGPLTMKKCVMAEDDGVAVEHGADDNVVERLLERENAKEDEQREQREREKEEKKERKRRKKEKRKKRKQDMDKAKNGGNDEANAMDCDEPGDDEEDQDDDIKMGDGAKAKKAKQNTLGNYFKKSPKKPGDAQQPEVKEQKSEEQKVDVAPSEQEAKVAVVAAAPPKKKKKRRVVMCELVE